MKLRTTAVALLLAILTATCLLPACGTGEPKEKGSSHGIEVGESVHLGEVTFESYQGGSFTGDIEWLVLDIEEDKALLVAESGIECRPFDEESNDWASSDMRQFLNEDFFNALSESTRQVVCPADLGDAGTTDKVFLLSVDEALDYFGSGERCSADYVGIEVEIAGERPYEGLEHWWWLRTPGMNGVGVSLGSSAGPVSPQGDNVFSSYYAVRPAMWVQLPLDQNAASEGSETSGGTSEPAAREEVDEAPVEPAIPEGAIDWNEAGQHVGEVVTVFGPVVKTNYASTSNGAPTFIDLGLSYPDAGRVSVVVWGGYRGNFPYAPEEMYAGSTVCVTGMVYLYDGVCNIEVQSPSQIEIVS